MNDLISREAVLKELTTDGITVIRPEDAAYKMAINAARLVVQTTPAIDAVPVVRCGECVRGRDKDYEHELLHCKAFGTMPFGGFCSFGERREMMVELKPCPLCGGTARLLEVQWIERRLLVFRIKCIQCETEFSIEDDITQEHPSEDRMFRKWNRRANDVS